jgi:molybdopterin converting factor small subunit
VTLRLFAAAREAAGTGQAQLRARTVADAVADACATYGAHFEAVVARSRVWVNGEELLPAAELADGDEVAILPPVSGGADGGVGSDRFPTFAPGAPVGVQPGTIRT